MRTWVALHAVPWRSMIPGAALTAAGLAAAQSWDWAAGLLPLAMAVSAAAGAQVFEDDALAVTSVTPRGGSWARSTRLAAAGVPLVWWSAAVASWPAAGLDVAGWLLAGLAVCSLGAGAAGVASGAGVARPGSAVAAALVTLVLAPIVLGPFLERATLFPGGAFPGWVLGTWAALAAVGALLCLAALTPGGVRAAARPVTARRRAENASSGSP